MDEPIKNLDDLEKYLLKHYMQLGNKDQMWLARALDYLFKTNSKEK